MKKRFTIMTLALCASLTVSAQVENDWNHKVKEAQENNKKHYEEYRQQVLQDYENFRRQINADYARFMEEAWKHFEANPAEEIPWQPKPPQPIVANPQPNPTSDPIPYTLAPIGPKPIDSPQPIEPIVYKPKPQETADTIRFFGTDMRFHFDKSKQIKLEEVNEKSVAALWLQLSEPCFDNLIADCLSNRTEFNLSDWGYIMLTKQVAETLCSGHTNEAVVLHMFLLTQSGFQVRIGLDEQKHLCVLIGSLEKIYHFEFFPIDGVRYYNFNNDLQHKHINIFDHAFPQEKTISLRMSQPRLAVSPTEPRTIKSKRFPDVSVTVVTNQNLINFYNSCPLSSQWNYYSAASVSSTLKESLYPALHKAIEGKSQGEAANILLNFVQTGFAYATDHDQFGYERPLYPDESFYYPFNDCEDRSALFSCLVRELLGLDAVLLDYPEHLATAVRFTDPVAGDYLDIDGKRYIICDPTYIGAEIGRCMPRYKSVRPKIQKF